MIKVSDRCLFPFRRTIVKARNENDKEELQLEKVTVVVEGNEDDDNAELSKPGMCNNKFVF